MEDRKITFTQDNGKEVEAEILFTHFSEETKKNYVVFKVIETGELSAAIFVEKDGYTGEIAQIKTEEEWEMLEDLLNDYYDRQELEDVDGCDSNCDSCSCHTCPSHNSCKDYIDEDEEI